MKVLLVLAALIAVALARPNSYGSSSQYEAPFRYGYVAKDDGYRRASYKSDYAYAPAHVEEQGSCPPWGTSSYSNGKIGGRSCFPGTNKYPKTDYAYEPKQYSEPSYTHTKTEYAPITYDYVKSTPVKHTTYTDDDDDDYVKPTYTTVYEAKPYHAPAKAYYAPEARAVEQGSCAPWGVSSYEHGQIGGRSCFPGTNKYPKTDYAYQSKQYSEPSYIKTEYAPTTYDYVKPTPVKHTTYTDDYDYVKPTYAAEVYDVKPYHAPTKAYYAPEARAVEQGSCAPWGVSSYEHGKVGGRSCFPGARSAAYPKTEYAPAKPAAVEYNKPNWHYRRQ